MEPRPDLPRKLGLPDAVAVIVGTLIGSGICLVPNRMWGYPVTPGLFAAVAFGFVLNTILSTPKPALAGLLLMATGIPVYAVWRRQA